MGLQGAIFDMDGTLLDSMPEWRRVGPAILAELGFSIPREKLADLAEMQALLADAAVAEHLRRVCAAAEPGDWLRREIHRRMAAFYAAQVRPKPGVAAFLSLLRRRGIGAYVATATGRDMAETALKTAGIREYLQGLVTSEEAGSHKSASPRIYEMALAALGCPREGAVVFEDALYAARTAKAAGFRVAAVYDITMERDQAALKELCDSYILSFAEIKDPDALAGGSL